MSSKALSSATTASRRRRGEMVTENSLEHEAAMIALDQRQIDIDRRLLQLKQRRKAMVHRTNIDLTMDSDEEVEAQNAWVKKEIKQEPSPTKPTPVQQQEFVSAGCTEQDAAANTIVPTTDASPTTAEPKIATATPISFRPANPAVGRSYRFVNATVASKQVQEPPSPQKTTCSPESFQTTPIRANISHSPQYMPPSLKRTLEKSVESGPDERDSPQSTSTNDANPTFTLTPFTKRRRRGALPACLIVDHYRNALKKYFSDYHIFTIGRCSKFEKVFLRYSQIFGTGPSGRGKRPPADTPEMLHQRLDSIVEELTRGGAEVSSILRPRLKWMALFCLIWWPACKSIPTQDERERLIEKVIQDTKKDKYDVEEYYQIASTGRMP